jgi:streptomycin 6-kinase
VADGYTPSVLAVDESVGALVLEAIEPGTPLVESPTYPDMGSVAELLTSLHATGAPDPSYPPLAQHVAYLFNSGTRPYERRPELVDVVPLELYERGRRLATRLVGHVLPTALLHGDLTPNNSTVATSVDSSRATLPRASGMTWPSTQSTCFSGKQTTSR